MRRYAVPLLTLSLATNVALGILYVRIQSGASAHVPIKRTDHNTTWSVDAKNTEAREYYTKEIAVLPISDLQKKQLLILYLRSRYIATDEKTADQYWTLENRAQRHSTASAPGVIRNDLLLIFGQTAVDEPLFKTYFRPLDQQLPFLSSKAQVAVSEALIQEHLETERVMASSALPDQRAALQIVREATQAKLRRILSEQEYSEYYIRMSSMADAIRRLNLNLSEEDYRKLFAIIDADPVLKAAVLRSGNANRPSRQVYNADISNLLGRERYLRYLRQLDPMYFMMTKAAQERGMPPSDLLVTYGKLVASQEAIIKLTGTGDVKSARLEIAKRRKLLEETFGFSTGMMLAGLADNIGRS